MKFVQSELPGPPRSCLSWKGQVSSGWDDPGLILFYSLFLGLCSDVAHPCRVHLIFAFSSCQGSASQTSRIRRTSGR